MEAGLSLEEVLHKIYFQGYSFGDVELLLESAFKKISNVDEFLEVLTKSINAYMTTSR